MMKIQHEKVTFRVLQQETQLLATIKAGNVIEMKEMSKITLKNRIDIKLSALKRSSK